MTEQYTPSDYDIHVQNPRIDQLESLITAEYEPPQGAQYSYPVANQGITQDQFRQMNLHTGDGVVVTDEGHHSFYLEGHDSDAETNARNTLLLKVSRETGRNEAILAGFYFRQTEDIELPFPAVTSTTTYYVTVTYDPRKFKTDPLRVEVWAGDPPRAHGQRHIVLHTVVRQPNQVLSQSVREMRRQYVSPVISVHHRDRLPEPTDVLYGSIAVKANRTVGGVLQPGTGELWESRGQYGWSNLLIGEWENMPLSQNAHNWSGRAQCRKVVGGLEVYVVVTAGNGTPSGSYVASLPDGLTFKNSWYTTCVGGGQTTGSFYANPSNSTRSFAANINNSSVRVSAVIPDYCLNNL